MSTFKWFLLIVSMAVAPEIDTTSPKTPYDRMDGVYCNYVCGYRHFPGDAALCFVVYGAKVNAMVARRPSFKTWQFYPMNTKDYQELMTDPNSICDRISEGDKYEGEDRCLPSEEKIQRQPFDSGFPGDDERFAPKYADHKTRGCNDEEYKRKLVAEMEQAVGLALRQYGSASAKRSGSRAMRQETEVQQMVRLMKEVRQAITIIEGLVHLDHGALPINVSSYTSEEWANATATLTIIRDEAKENKQPDLEKLVYALDKVLPILNAINITSEKKRTLGNAGCLSCFMNALPGPVTGATGQRNSPSDGPYSPSNFAKPMGIFITGQPRKDEKEDVAEDSESEEATEETARSDVELPDEKEATKSSETESSLETAKNKLKSDLNVIKNFLDAYGSTVKYRALASLPPVGNGIYENVGNLVDFENYKNDRNGADRNFGLNINPGNGGYPSPVGGAQLASSFYPGIPSQAGGVQPAAPFYPGNPGQAVGSQPAASFFPGTPSQAGSAQPAASFYPGIPGQAGGAQPAALFYPGIPSQASGAQPAASFYPGIPGQAVGSQPAASIFPGSPSEASGAQPAASSLLGLQGQVGGANPTHSSPKTQLGAANPANVTSQSETIDIRSSHEVCQFARKYLCEQQKVMIYTSDSHFCVTSYKNNFVCNLPSENCFRDINYMLESIQWY